MRVGVLNWSRKLATSRGPGVVFLSARVRWQHSATTLTVATKATKVQATAGFSREAALSLRPLVPSIIGATTIVNLRTLFPQPVAICEANPREAALSPAAPSDIEAAEHAVTRSSRLHMVIRGIKCAARAMYLMLFISPLLLCYPLTRWEVRTRRPHPRAHAAVRILTVSVRPPVGSAPVACSASRSCGGGGASA